MKLKKITFTTIALSALAATPNAFAGDGVYLSGGINSTTQESLQSRNTGTNLPNTGATGGPSGTVVDKDTGIGFFGGVGYKTHFTNDFFASVEAFYSFEDAETTTLNNVKVNNVELNETYGVDIRLGTDVSDKVGIYGLASLTAHEFDSNLSYTFAPPTEFVSETEWGFVYGGGVEIALTDQISTFGEFRIVNDLDFDTPVDQGGVQAEEKLNYTTLRTGVRYSF